MKSQLLLGKSKQQYYTNKQTSRSIINSKFIYFIKLNLHSQTLRTLHLYSQLQQTPNQPIHHLLTPYNQQFIIVTLCKQQQNMQRSDFQKNLPKLKTSSQIRFRSNSKGHSYTEEGKNDFKMMALKQQNSTTYVSKAMKYETSGVIYIKKKEEEELRLKNIEAEIKFIQKQLEKRRAEITDQKRIREHFVLDQQKEDFSVISINGLADKGNNKKKGKRRIINLNDPKEVKTQIQQTLANIKYLKKKANQIKSQNNSIFNEVNRQRKQINTIKGHLSNLIKDLEEQSETYQSVLQENKLVSEEVAKKHLQLHQRKAEKAHEETKKLKRYDQILRSITREMEDEKLKASSKPNFYITEVNHTQIRSPTRSPGKRSVSPSKRRLNVPLSELQTLLKQYQEQFSQMRMDAGTENMDQIGKQYVQNQKQTYAIYKFINGLSQDLKNKTQQQEQLKERLQKVNEQSVFRYTSVQQAALDEMNENLQRSKKNNRKSREDQLVYQKIIKDLKLSIPVMIDRLKITVDDYPDLSQFNLNKIQEKDLISLLIIIQKRKGQIIDNNQVLQNKVLKINQHQVQEQIQNAKKEFSQLQRTESKPKELQNKYQKFMDQNEMMKTIDLTSRSKKDKKAKS